MLHTYTIGPCYLYHWPMPHTYTTGPCYLYHWPMPHTYTTGPCYLYNWPMPHTYTTGPCYLYHWPMPHTYTTGPCYLYHWPMPHTYTTGLCCTQNAVSRIAEYLDQDENDDHPLESCVVHVVQLTAEESCQFTAVTQLLVHHLQHVTQAPQFNTRL